MDTNTQNNPEKRALITRWEATAIGLHEAEQRRLIRISSPTFWRNWACREALYDFAQRSAHAAPVLVRIDTRRVALYTTPPPPLPRKKKTTPTSASASPSTKDTPSAPASADPWSGSTI